MIDAATHRKISERMGATWIHNGLMLHYPLCCIAHFLIVPPSERNGEVPEAFKDTGFIPCPECAKRPLDVLKHIDRRTERGVAPFPNADI